ncbi:sugar ABC transporter ATP-binding protein [Acidisoma cellulosilytica]|uniref:Sugar ABC transporter ATP-binding protein n=1 Tax=Acidisoma cellulosilyticum TaxID=2802395 RepID=A0A964E4P8_9PROT|nr:sugar ABC transporter ATP-binding protein [Acidisoma cellulosilyticum]MCB8881522.1 sugar ABC transporter ATP-binding protein [Acidisoma cellulosilyticum]
MLRMQNIAKRYGATLALEHVDLEVAAGEVMALLGENGAGKSTLVKILSGLEHPDAGSIEVNGAVRAIASPGQAKAMGISYVAQELSVIGCLSVAENVLLGDTTIGVFRSQSRLARLARPYLERVGLGYIDALRPAESFSVAERQLIEIARLLSRKTRIAILDEPTATLSETEIDRVKAAVRALAAEGCAVVYVTHRLGEVFELAGRATIIRNGRSFPAVATSSVTVDQLIEMMLGRRLDQMFPERRGGGGDELLVIKDCLCPGLTAPISLTLRKGEMIGFAGQIGSGANAILKMMAGLLPIQQGSISLHGKPFTPSSAHASIAAQIAFCSDDRKRDGIFAARNLFENLTAPTIDGISRLGVIDRTREAVRARGIAQQFDIDVNKLGRLAGNLSGGNQQKVALGKWIGLDPSILMVEEPTRGVDVGARAEIYRHLRRQTDAGLSVLFSSSDTHEVHGLADRVGTFFRGRLIDLAPASTMTVESMTRAITHPDLAA